MSGAAIRGQTGRLLRLFALMAVVTLAGCAAISEEECHTANWYQRGLADGSAGRASSYVDSYTRVCARAGVQVNVSSWQSGRQEGLQQYCTPDRGREEGLQGRPYRNVCPGHLEAGFLHSYQAGRDVYDAERELDRLDSRINSKERQLRKARHSRDRHSIRRTIRSLDDDAAEARYRLRRAEERLNNSY